MNCIERLFSNLRPQELQLFATIGCVLGAISLINGLVSSNILLQSYGVTVFNTGLLLAMWAEIKERREG